MFRPKSTFEKERALYWRKRPWVIALRLIIWVLTLPLALIAYAGEKIEDALDALGSALPAVSVRRCCGSPRDHKPGCPRATS